MAGTQNITLKVEGMTCGHCKMTVEKTVKALEGVASAEVDLAAKQVAVTFDSDKVSVAAIKEAIDDQGYDVIG
ncbi:MAG TPA: copper chaperone CopZ [Bacillota bacterium]|nr:copper chaperone CopZ [Bacillota bacterium]